MRTYIKTAAAAICIVFLFSYPTPAASDYRDGPGKQIYGTDVTITGNSFETGMKKFLNADQKSAAIPGMHVSSATHLTIGDGGFKVPVDSHMELWYRNLGTPEMEFLTKVTNTALNADTTEYSFYTGGVYYSDNSQRKLKTPLDYTEMMRKLPFGGNSSLYGGMMKEIQYGTNADGNTVLLYQGGDGVLEDASVLPFGEVSLLFSGYSVLVEELEGSAVLSPEGYFLEEEISALMHFQKDTDSVSARMEVSIRYDNPGQTVEIAFPSTEDFSEVPADQ